MAVVVLLVVVLRLSSGNGSGIRRYWQMLMLFCSWLVEEHLQPCKLGPMSPLAPPPLPGGIPGGWPLWGDVEIPPVPIDLGFISDDSAPENASAMAPKKAEKKAMKKRAGTKTKKPLGKFATVTMSRMRNSAESPDKLAKIISPFWKRATYLPPYEPNRVDKDNIRKSRRCGTPS